MRQKLEIDSETIGQGDFCTPVVVEFDIFCTDSEGSDWEFQIVSVTDKVTGKEIEYSADFETEFTSSIENLDYGSEAVQAYEEYSQGMADYYYDLYRDR